MVARAHQAQEGPPGCCPASLQARTSTQLWLCVSKSSMVRSPNRYRVSRLNEQLCALLLSIVTLVLLKYATLHILDYMETKRSISLITASSLSYWYTPEAHDLHQIDLTEATYIVVLKTGEGEDFAYAWLCTCMKSQAIAL
ncbi:hypothetical protein P171DRAFT_447872 [Karstenula rhodostoma CBS 690.94]|uniref:Uncharacterized protein n=1 Tax=Karstenula rhodostoma CBS 690.94 TaxID=1392251 RepID=A0A9P4U7J2_9PLEO|nr:hypothetical protein P171DRAFT_447872 [Karstenula rhodostoma CBS 690.94]